MKNGSYRYCFLFLSFLLLASPQLKAAWCLTSNTYNAGTVVPPNISSSAAYTTTINSATKSGKIVYWSFTATAGVTYHFDVCQSSTTDDTMLFLYNGPSGSGSLIASNDDYVTAAPVSGLPMNKSGIDWTCGSNGTYYIVTMKYVGACGTTLTNNGNIILSCYYNFNINCSSTRALPFAENFDSWGSCWVSSLALTSGSGSSSAAWSVWPSNDAGGTAPEAVLDQGQACAGCVETSVFRLSQPLNTFSVTSMQLSFKHSLYTTSGVSASGSVSGNLYLETSSNGTTWTTRWTQAYSGSSSTDAIQTLFNQVSVTTVPFNPNLGNPSYSNLTYVRFRVVGVLFKLYQWHVDQGAMTPLTTLPVELVSFTAEKTGTKEVELKWTTATEKNNKSFMIERSLDGNNFEEIKTVKGSGNANHMISYSTIDAEPHDGINYYRLKTTGFDNLPVYSKVTYVEFLGDRVQLGDLYPNPTSREIAFDFYAPVKGILNLQIVDYIGHVIKEEITKTEEGKTTISTNLEDLSQGVYYMKTTFDKTGDRMIKKIIKD